VLRQLKAAADPRVLAKMAYFGVDVPKAHGISAPVLHRSGKTDRERSSACQAALGDGYS
jgi:hypothetical protein